MQDTCFGFWDARCGIRDARYDTDTIETLTIYRTRISHLVSHISGDFNYDYLCKMPLLNWGEIVFYVFAAVTAVQVFYFIWFFSRTAFYKRKKKQQSQQHPVSVIICARDEDENLARNLPGVLVQSYSSTMK